MFISSLCSALNRAKVGYAVVGGFAVALHGAVRGTVDLDIVLSMDEKTFLTAEKVFLNQGLQPRLPVGAKQIFNFKDEYISQKNLVAWSFFDPVLPANQLDVIITHDFKQMSYELMDIEGTKIKVASIEDLIAMKTKSGRPQDHEDIKALRSIQKNAKK